MQRRALILGLCSGLILACSGVGSSEEKKPKNKGRKRKAPTDEPAPLADEDEGEADGGEGDEQVPDEAWQPSEQEIDEQGRPRPVRPRAPPAAGDHKTGER